MCPSPDSSSEMVGVSISGKIDSVRDIVGRDKITKINRTIIVS